MALSGGQGLKQAIHVARARTAITSDRQLALAAGVSYDTFMNWFGDKTVPRPHEVKKVADTLGVSYGDLLAAYDGRDTEPPPLHEAIRELVVEMRQGREQQHEELMTLLRTLTVLVSGSARITG